MGHVIFNLHLGVGHSVLCQMEGVGHVFSNHHILKCSYVLFGQSLNELSLFSSPVVRLTRKRVNTTQCRGESRKYK